MSDSVMICEICGFEQAIPDSVTRFSCSNCGVEYAVGPDKSVSRLAFETDTDSLFNSDSTGGAVEASNTRKDGFLSKIMGAQEGTSLYRVVLILLIAAILTSLCCLSVVVFREIQARSLVSVVTLPQVDLQVFATSLISTPTETLASINTVTGKFTSTPWPTQIIGTVNPLIIKLREGPGIEYGIIRELNQLTTLSPLGRDESSKWIFVSTRNGLRGWVSYFSLVNFNFRLSELPIITYGIPSATKSATLTPTIGETVIPSPSFTLTQTATTSSTPTRTHTPTATSSSTRTRTPTRTNTPTRTRTATKTITPTNTRTGMVTPLQTSTTNIYPSLPSPPDGGWCAQNTVRLICAQQIAYHFGSVDATPEAEAKLYIAMDIYVKNLSSFEIFVDPGKFTLKLANGGYGYFLDVPQNIPQNQTLIRYTTIAPGENTEGVLYMRVSNFNTPESLTYRGYIFESTLSIELIDTP